MRDIDLEIYGRGMYEIMNGYWPTADQDPNAPAYAVEFARIWQATPKLVFSNSLQDVAGNSRLTRASLADVVPALKQQPGKDIAIGGATIAASALKLGLVDEVRLFVNPVVLGAGKPMFPRLEQRLALDLVDTHTFASGVHYVAYRRRD